MLDFIFDMETQDPDDFFTLALLCTHPRVNLIAITVTPGTPHQIGVVRHTLDLLGKGDLPVGAFNIDHVSKKKKKHGPYDHVEARGKATQYSKCVSGWHYDFLGNIPPSREAEIGWQVLYENLGTNTILVTGGPKKNLGALLKNWEMWDREIGVRRVAGPSWGTWVAQGGFAGEGVVPLENQLPKFKGLVTAPTFNLNGDPKSGLAALECPYFRGGKWFVSKNVCHGVIYDQQMQEEIQALNNPHPGLELIIKGMGLYLKRKPKGKKFHDPLAAMCALDRSIGTWAEVEIYREKGKWGARLQPGSNTKIITDYDRAKFIQTMAE